SSPGSTPARPTLRWCGRSCRPRTRPGCACSPKASRVAPRPSSCAPSVSIWPPATTSTARRRPSTSSCSSRSRRPDSPAARPADLALASRTRAGLDAVADQIRQRGRRAIVCAVDVNDLAAVAQLVDQTVSELGRLDIVVNNAGGSVSYPFLDTRVEQLEASFHFNVSVAFEL